MKRPWFSTGFADDELNLKARRAPQRSGLFPHSRQRRREMRTSRKLWRGAGAGGEAVGMKRAPYPSV